MTQSKIVDVDMLGSIGDFAGFQIPFGILDCHRGRSDIDMCRLLSVESSIKDTHDGYFTTHSLFGVIIPQQRSGEAVIVSRAVDMNVQIVAFRYNLRDAEVVEQRIDRRHDADMSLAVFVAFIGEMG